MTSDILDLIHCRDKFLYNFKKCGNHDDYVNSNNLEIRSKERSKGLSLDFLVEK